MKTTLNVLKVFCTLLVISMFIDFIKSLSNVISGFFNAGKRFEVFNLQIPESWPDAVYHFLSIVALCLIIYVVFLAVDFRQVVFNFSKDKVFTEENSKQLRKIGKGLVVYGVIMLVLNIVLGITLIDFPDVPHESSAYNAGAKFGSVIRRTIKNSISIFVVALFVQFISFIVVKGNVLQEENNLTI